MAKTIPKIIISRLISIAVFLLIIWLMNFMVKFTDNAMVRMIVGFVNETMWLLILMSVLFGLGEVFFAMRFPLNLPGPLFNGVAALLLVSFIYDMFVLIDRLVNIQFLTHFRWLMIVAYPLVFILVVVIGYMVLLNGNKGKRKSKKK